MRSLGVDWDSYGGRPITEAALETASLLRVVPRCCGGLCVVIQDRHGGYIDLDIEADGSIDTNTVLIRKNDVPAKSV